jgi:hypothetical protein
MVTYSLSVDRKSARYNCMDGLPAVNGSELRKLGFLIWQKRSRTWKSATLALGQVIVAISGVKDIPS